MRQKSRKRCRSQSNEYITEVQQQMVNCGENFDHNEEKIVGTTTGGV
jgi:hypothetical protein